MKNTPFDPRTKLASRLASVIISFTVAATCLSGNLNAAIIAGFDGGGSSASPVTDEVDAWTGMAGNGWSDAWGTLSNSSGVTVSSSVLNTSPLQTGEGNYLSTTVTSSIASTRSSTNFRQYTAFDGVTLSTEHTVSFLYRLDTLPTDLSRVNIWDGTAGSSGVPADRTWFIRTGGTNWFFESNGSLVDSGIAWVQGDVFAFTLALNPAANSYVGTLTNLNTTSTFTSGTLGFNDDRGSVGGFLNFGITTNGNATSTYSLDSVMVVVPEPSVTGLAVLGVLGMIVLSLHQRSRPRKEFAHN